MSPATQLARLVADALAVRGVGHVLLCPGSRSAPLAYQLHRRDLAGDAPRLAVRHDERVAGFSALGVGAAAAAGLGTGIGAVLTTSGTAVANLHPAVLEAHHANIPLVLLTADRPPRLRGTWANQTTELQAGLFGPAVRARLDLDDVTAAADPAAAWRSLLATLAAATGPGRPGPVHLDLGFSEPLLPDGTDGPGFAPEPVPAGAPPERELITAGPRTVVVAGDGAGPGARRFAEAAGLPLLAEPSSRSRGGRNAAGPYRLLLELPGLGDRIERVVVFGRPTLSRPVTALLSRPDVELVLASPYPHWPEPGRPARRVGPGPEPAGVGDPGWLERWRYAAGLAERALDEVLPDGPLNGPLLARELAAAMTPGECLVTASSNPVRDLDLAFRPVERPPAVLANRGLAGIDGTVSTATGVALGSGRPVRALVGDVAFLHDANALLGDPAVSRPPVQVVVLNDDGGGIFSLLEYGDRAAGDRAGAVAFERLFGTPHGADLGALCRGYGVPHRVAEDLAGLREALAGPPPGTAVVEVRASRAGLRELHGRIRAAVHDAVRSGLPDELRTPG